MEYIYQMGTVYIGAPKWFYDLNKAHPEFFSHNAGVDHIRHYRDILLLQPYQAHGPKLAKMLTFLEEQGYVVVLLGLTNYYVGYTFTIAVYKPTDQRVYDKFMAQVRKTEMAAPVRREATDGGAR